MKLNKKDKISVDRYQVALCNLYKEKKLYEVLCKFKKDTVISNAAFKRYYMYLYFKHIYIENDCIRLNRYCELIAERLGLSRTVIFTHYRNFKAIIDNEEKYLHNDLKQIDDYYTSNIRKF